MFILSQPFDDDPELEFKLKKMPDETAKSFVNANIFELFFKCEPKLLPMVKETICCMCKGGYIYQFPEIMDVNFLSEIFSN